MKIKQNHLSILESLRDSLIKRTGKTLQELHQLALPVMQEDIDKIKDIGVYTRWQLNRISGFNGHKVNGESLVNVLYSYMDDEHINTALKKVWGI